MSRAIERASRDSALGLHGRRSGRELELERQLVSQTYLDVYSYLTPQVELRSAEVTGAAMLTLF